MSSQRGKRAIASTGGLSNLILICFVATANTGVEDGIHLIGGSVIVAPTSEIRAQAQSEVDEVIFCQTDLALGDTFKQNVFKLAAHRRPELYQLIIDRLGSGEPLGKPPKD